MVGIAMPGGIEWLIIAGVIILLFGAKKLPEMARSLGRSSSEFKKGMSDGTQSADDEDAPKKSDDD